MLNLLLFIIIRYACLFKLVELYHLSKVVMCASLQIIYIFYHGARLHVCGRKINHKIPLINYCCLIFILSILW